MNYMYTDVKELTCIMCTDVKELTLKIRIVIPYSIQSCVHDPHANISDISSSYSSNFEAFASELLENLKEMFTWYSMHIDIFSMIISSTTHWCVTRREGFILFRYFTVVGHHHNNSLSMSYSLE